MVPDVVGMTQAAASAAITAVYNLKVGTVTQQHSDTVAAGLVISQNPVGVTSVDIGSSVNLVISLGVSVPDPTPEPTVPPSSWDNGVGDAYYQFGDKVHIWDLSGSYSHKASEWQLNYVLKQDASGKITGTGTASNSAVNSGAAQQFTLKGGINAAGLVKLTLKGASIKGQIKATVNAGSKALSGTLKMGKQSASFTAALPAGMDGSAVLEIHCSSAGKSTPGTAKVTLSNGTAYNFSVKGKFNGKSDESTLTLKGNAKGTSLKLKVGGSDGTIKTLKGKMLGQTLNATNISP